MKFFSIFGLTLAANSMLALLVSGIPIEGSNSPNLFIQTQPDEVLSAINEDDLPQEIYAPSPYEFSFGTNSDGSSSSRQESADGSGKVIGKYAIKGADGRERIVSYRADADGFRANITTNELGTENQNPSFVVFKSSQLPAPEISRQLQAESDLAEQGYQPSEEQPAELLSEASVSAPEGSIGATPRKSSPMKPTVTRRTAPEISRQLQAEGVLSQQKEQLLEEQPAELLSEAPAPTKSIGAPPRKSSLMKPTVTRKTAPEISRQLQAEGGLSQQKEQLLEEQPAGLLSEAPAPMKSIGAPPRKSSPMKPTVTRKTAPEISRQLQAEGGLSQQKEQLLEEQPAGLLSEAPAPMKSIGAPPRKSSPMKPTVTRKTAPEISRQLQAEGGLSQQKEQLLDEQPAELLLLPEAPAPAKSIGTLPRKSSPMKPTVARRTAQQSAGPQQRQISSPAKSSRRPSQQSQQVSAPSKRSMSASPSKSTVVTNKSRGPAKTLSLSITTPRPKSVSSPPKRTVQLEEAQEEGEARAQLNLSSDQTDKTVQANEEEQQDF